MNDKKDKTKEDLLYSLRKKMESWYTFASEDIERLRLHRNFLCGDQWEPKDRLARANSNKPTLQFNKLRPIVLSILGEQRKNNISVQVSDTSVELKTPQQTIDLYNDFAREVMSRDDVQTILQQVFQQAIEGGWGTSRVILEYEKGTFNQIPRIVEIADQETAFWDPAAQSHDKMDGNYCGVYERMSWDSFKGSYPDIESPESLAAVTPVNQQPIVWTDEKTIIVAEIYVKEHFNKTIVQLSTGQVMEEKDAKALINSVKELLGENEDLLEILQEELPQIVDKRVDKGYKIKHYKFIQNQILEETDFPGTYLPIPYCEGDSAILEGRRVPLPLLTEAVDAQKAYNFVVSEIILSQQLARKEQWIGTDAHFDGKLHIWNNPDQIQSALTYNVDPDNPQSRPERFEATPFNANLLQLADQYSRDLQELTGRHEESRGAESNAMSGTAIAYRRAAGNLPVNVYQDNLARFLKSLFLIVFDLFREVMQEEGRPLLVRGRDGKRDVRKLNVRNGFNFDQETGEMSPRIDNDVKNSLVDVEVKIEASLDEQRQQSAEFLLDLCRIAPPLVPLVSDMIAQNSGFVEAAKLTQRLETLVDPKILAQEKGTPPPPPQPPPPPDPLVQAARIRLEGQQMELEYKQQELQQKTAQMYLDAQVNQIDAQTAMSKARAEMAKSDNALKQSAINHVATLAKGHHELQKIRQQQLENKNGE